MGGKCQFSLLRLTEHDHHFIKTFRYTCQCAWNYVTAHCATSPSEHDFDLHQAVNFPALNMGVACHIVLYILLFNTRSAVISD